ncbi:GGDEF domain-containing protein, partial [Deinococcus pimensis]|uniref:GGDEF domain-containing protein n=1 Tax=Deinococcus pimensis TaxID=309888 RepID=UPI0005EB3EE5
ARDAGGTVALAFVDLDGFKPINDRFGHDVGDEVLRLLARRMERELAALGTWGRLGGDEFVLLLADPARASTVREEIQNALRAPFEVDGHAITVGASVGVSEETGGQHDAAFLIRAADHAMYVVKRGRGRRVTDHA